MKRLTLVAALLAASSVLAQTTGGHVPPAGAPADPSQFKPLPERKDVVSWKLLAQVELVKEKERYVPKFPSVVSALHEKEVKIQGFMMPLEMGDKQSHFILSATPQSCAFCMPAGPESLVEVKSKKPVTFGFEPVVLTGKLAVMKDDPTGVFYRLTDAVPAK